MVSILFLLKTDYKHIKLSSSMSQNDKTYCDNYHDIRSLQLLLTVKIGRYQLLPKKISVNRQNRIIAHP